MGGGRCLEARREPAEGTRSGLGLALLRDAPAAVRRDVARGSGAHRAGSCPRPTRPTPQLPARHGPGRGLGPAGDTRWPGRVGPGERRTPGAEGAVWPPHGHGGPGGDGSDVMLRRGWERSQPLSLRRRLCVKPVLLGPAPGRCVSAPQGHVAAPRRWRFCGGAGLGGPTPPRRPRGTRRAWGTETAKGPTWPRRSSPPRTRSSVVHVGAAGGGVSGRGPVGASRPSSPETRAWARRASVPDVAGRGRWGHTHTHIHIHVCVCTGRAHTHPSLHLVLARSSTGSKGAGGSPPRIGTSCRPWSWPPGSRRPARGCPPREGLTRPWNRPLLLPFKSVFREKGLGALPLPPTVASQPSALPPAPGPRGLAERGWGAAAVLHR